MYNIIVCDDERDIVSALEIYLTAEGYHVLRAENGREALPPDAVTVTIARCPENDSWRSITIAGGEPL